MIPVTLTLMWCVIGSLSKTPSGAKLLSPGARPLSDEEYLLHNLFELTRYNPSARPVINSTHTVSVQIQFSLMHIKDLDVRSQILTTTGLLILVWEDERLKWQPENHNNLKDIILEARELWTPEFAVINGAEKIYEDYNQFRAVLSHEGQVHWEPGGVFKTMCTIDITYYPFDEQMCSLTFGAWSYHTNKMNLTNKESTVNLDSYKENGEWDIIATEVQRNEFSYECCPEEKYSNVNFKIYLRRRHMFYILNVILPSIMTSVLLLSIFFCTPGQKVQIGVVVLLSFRIFLLNVAGEIPKTSDHIPLLGIYLTCTMAITTLSMVLTVFVLNLHHISDRPVPNWARKLILIYLARALVMCTTVDRQESDNNTNRSRPQNNKYRRHFRSSYTGFDNDEEETSAIIELHQKGKVKAETEDMEPKEEEGCFGNSHADGFESPWVLRHSPRHQRHVEPQINNYNFHRQVSPQTEYYNQLHRQPEPRSANYYLRYQMELRASNFGLPRHGDTRAPNAGNRLKSEPRPPDNHVRCAPPPTDNKPRDEQQPETAKDRPKPPDYSKEWTRVAEIFDRLFFWLFLFAILITTLVLFHPLTKSYLKQPTDEG